MISARAVSIRTQIFLGCLSLTAVTILVGLLSLGANNQISGAALDIYDNAFIPMSYLRSAQSIVLAISRDLAIGESADAVFIDQLQSVEDALDVARERAMSPRGEAIAKQLQLSVSDLQSRLRDHTGPLARTQFTAVEQMFDMAVQIYTGDGYHLRSSAEALVLRERRQICEGILGSIATAFIITLMLSRAIVPPIRHAVRIASAIAAGGLDNRIDRHGPSETAVLLDALAAMQDSIAEKIKRIETLMVQQASSHAAEISSQHARFEAALNNMTMGLCMFDAGDNLVVQNRRFRQMFPALPGRISDHEALAQLRLCGPDPSHDQRAVSRSFNCLLDDGRTIAVSEEEMTGGGRVVTYEDITERQQAEARLSHMARHDALTGLPNRVLFRERLEHGMAEVRSGGSLAVLCLDLDRFKAVNDALGHPVGDALLQESAARLTAAIGGDDIVVRLGGDEFAVIQFSAMPGDPTAIPTDRATALADRLIHGMATPFEIDGHLISISTSIGIATAADGAATPDDLLKNADLALYQAKADGGGSYRFFQSEMYARLHAKRQLEIDIRSAMAGEQFELFYQPLLSTRDGSVVAFEALIRWRHPDRGIVSPADFIPMAEEAGLIVDLGRWVLTRACRDAVTWGGEVKVAINLSPLQFRDANLVGDVTAALRCSGLSPNRLELEITESLMLQETDMTLQTLHTLRALGICISMDDFGTGYSSLSYLRRFPFDKIKIDRSFIGTMEEGSDSFAIVTAIISLGRSLRMSVVAEGVETDGQMALLSQAGCQEVQGYLFSRPRPVVDVPQLIERFAFHRVREHCITEHRDRVSQLTGPWIPGGGSAEPGPSDAGESFERSVCRA